MDETRLRDRRVLITGAASGIGRALAEGAMQAGAHVTLLDRNADALADVASRGRCTTHAIDVGDPDAWARLPHAEEPWDFVALNAGVMTAPPDAPPQASNLLTMDLSDYQRVMRVNVDGAVHGLRRLLPELADGGAIVVTASATGVVGFPADIPYAMSKHALVGLVRSLAPRLAKKRQGQRICAICPGGVRTNIMPQHFRDLKAMEPGVIADEIASLWLDGDNGEVRVKMRPELEGLRIDEPELPQWW